MEEGSTCFTRGKGVAHREMESKSVLLCLESGRYYTLNSTGTFIWSLLDGKSSLDQIARRVAEKFDVSREEAAGDVRDLLEDLEAENLVERCRGPE
jgi:hypothetical protein